MENAAGVVAARPRRRSRSLVVSWCKNESIVMKEIKLHRILFVLVFLILCVIIAYLTVITQQGIIAP